MRELPFIAIGGGLAGSAFTLELARNGARATVLESSRGPHHKVCGEFLSAEAQTLLAYLGLDLGALGASSMGTFRLVNGSRQAEASLPFRAAGLSRYRLDQTLLQRAGDAGADVVRGVTVSTVEARDGRVVAKTGTSGFEGRGALLATGKHNLRQFPRGQSDMVGFKLQLRLSESALRALENIVQLAMFDGGYVGACIVEDGIVTVCWVMHQAVLQRIGTGWPEQAAHFAKSSEIIGDLLQNARPEWDKPVAVAGIPYGYLRRGIVASNILPVGDQLAVIPSFTGDGMAIALYSGIAAAQAVLAGHDSALFQSRMIERLRPQFHWAAATNLLFDKRRLHGFSLRLAAALPGLVTRIAQSTRLRGFDDVVAGAKRKDRAV
ncbi:MAG TPA: FAD-dependent monooxygenase [Methyloceanibacter sp.]|nr:FAD-dependent monooxygenase [Methyloceanibacter sp.]